MGIEKISSLHDDMLVPKTTNDAGLGEYKDYPERFDPKEKSTIDRLEQFGVDIQQAEDTLGKAINNISWEEYRLLLSESIKARYDVVVSSVYDQYMLPSMEDPIEAKRKKEMFKLIKEYDYMDSKLGVNLIRDKNDFKDSGNLVLGLEAGSHLIKTESDVKKLASKGVKIFGLQYGADTPMATKSGLTPFGEKSIKYLLNENLIVDLAHSGYRTRQDVMQLAIDVDKGNLITYTHGCTEEDVDDLWKDKMGERALKEEEVKKIIAGGGIIGLGVTKPFFMDTKKVAERINDIAQLDDGIERIAIGSDFGGVPPAFINEIKSPEDFKILADILSQEFNMKDEDINKVVRTNAKKWLKEALD